MTETLDATQKLEVSGTPQASDEILTITEKAVAKIRSQFEKHGVWGQGGLRLGVQGGGCSGLSYLFKFEPKQRPKDHVLEYGDVRVFVDPKSAVYLKGLTLDWKDSLVQSGFVFENPNAKKACGCGTSFAG
jgi:iron-sulfur cluster assembly protein